MADGAAEASKPDVEAEAAAANPEEGQVEGQEGEGESGAAAAAAASPAAEPDTEPEVGGANEEPPTPATAAGERDDDGDADDADDDDDDEEGSGKGRSAASLSGEFSASSASMRRKGKKKKEEHKKVRWKWDKNRTNQDDWVITQKAFIKRNSDGEIRYLFGDTVLEAGSYQWGLKVGHSGFLYIGIVDADKFRGWRDTWMHTANHCWCVSYAGGIFYGNGKRLGTAKRIRDGSVVWVTVDCSGGVMTMTRGKDKVLCTFKHTPKKAIPWVGIGCANTAYELKF